MPPSMASAVEKAHLYKECRGAKVRILEKHLLDDTVGAADFVGIVWRFGRGILGLRQTSGWHAEA
jgi:hypothetical protein